MELLKLQHFSVSYDGEKNALEDVSLTISPGEIVTIVGESGSGKSTLLHGIQGLFPSGSSHSGQAWLLGKDITGLSQKELRALRGEQVAMIFQDTGRYMNPTAKIGRQYDAYLKLHRGLGRAEARRLEAVMLNKVHLTDPERVLDSYPFELSGGMRQRVGIAMAISLEPKLLLADEPTSALDVTVQAQVVRELLELRRKEHTAILMVTHNMGVAANISDRIGVMKAGRLVELGTAEEVIGHPKNEYTKSLLDSVIRLKDSRREQEDRV